MKWLQNTLIVALRIITTGSDAWATNGHGVECYESTEN